MRALCFSLMCMFFAASSPAHVNAGTLFGGGLFSGQLGNSFGTPLTFVLPDTPTFQYTSTESFGGDGSVVVQSGLYGEVRPDIAYIGITDGSYISVISPTTGVAPTTTGMSVDARINDIRYTPYEAAGYIPVPLYFYSQYKLTGYLAPGDSLAIAFDATLYGSGSGTVVQRLSDRTSINDPGAFSISYFDAVLVSNGAIPVSYDFTLGSAINIVTAAGHGQSWAVLDPGMGFSGDTANMPWAPVVAVPEPSSFLLFGLGGLGLVGTHRRRQAA